MVALSDLFAKFGEVAEAAQLLETQIGNLLLLAAAEVHSLEKIQNIDLARKIIRDIDRKTLGQLIKTFRVECNAGNKLEEIFAIALVERNRLNHSFYRQHNIRKFSGEGRLIMLNDLEAIHQKILLAYSSALALSKINISAEACSKAISGHLPI